MAFLPNRRRYTVACLFIGFALNICFLMWMSATQDTSEYFDIAGDNRMSKKGFVPDAGFSSPGELSGSTAVRLDSRDPAMNFDQSQVLNQWDGECHIKYNEFAFPDHGCLVNAPSMRAHCQLENLLIDKTKVFSESIGGEPLLSVLGQNGEGEFLRYEKGALKILRKVDHSLQPVQKSRFHYLNGVFEAVVVHPGGEALCEEKWTGTTLFITRYEYVNLYHTVTDWWNCFFSISDHTSPTNVVFLDAHPEGSLDPVWKDLFRGKIAFMNHLEMSMTCFEHARFIPPGYSAPLYPLPRPRESNCRSPVQMSSFVDYVLNTYNLSHIHRIPGRVVILERISYLDHPRRDLNKVERLLTNLRPLAESLPQRLTPYYGVNVTVKGAALVDKPMNEQIRTIREAHVLVANHGAGLTHSIFLDDATHVVEMSCDNEFFTELISWKPNVRHHCQPILAETIPDFYWDRFVVSVVEAAIKREIGRTIKSTLF
jgi:hypothetical protein